MSTDPSEARRPLPDRPNLRHLKDQARDLVKAGTAKSLTDAQFKIARRYGFPSWPKLKAYVESVGDTGQLKPAIDIDDRSAASEGNRALQLPVHTSEMYGAFSPDRSRLLTGGDGPDPKVHVWDVETGKCLYELTGHTRPVATLAWAVDQQWMASGAFDQSVRLWHVRSGNCLLILEGHRPYVRSIAFAQSRERLLSGAGDGVVRLWALPDGKLLQVFEGHTDGVYHAIFDASYSRVLSGGRDRTIRLWDVSTGRCVKVMEGPGVHVQCLAWHADQRRFLSCARDIRLWDAETGECLRILQGTAIRFDPWFGATTIAIFSRPPMTAQCGFGIPKRDAAFKCFRDTRSASSMLSGPSITDLLFHAAPAADSGAGNERIVLNRDEPNGRQIV